MKLTRYDKPMGHAEVTPESTMQCHRDRVLAFRKVAKDRGTNIKSYEWRVRNGVDPERAAQPERINHPDPQEWRNRYSRHVWRHRNPAESERLSDDEVDAIVAKNRGGERDPESIRYKCDASGVSRKSYYMEKRKTPGASVDEIVDICKARKRK